MVSGYCILRVPIVCYNKNDNTKYIELFLAQFYEIVIVTIPEFEWEKYNEYNCCVYTLHVESVSGNSGKRIERERKRYRWMSIGVKKY